MKRRLSDSSDAAGGTKRPRYDPDYTSFVDEDSVIVSTLRVQNTELFAKMKQLRENLAYFENNLKAEKENTNHIDTYLHTLDTLLSHFNSQVASLLSRLSANRGSSNPANTKLADLLDNVTSRSDYLNALQASLEPALSQSIDQTQKLLVSLVEEVERERAHWQAVNQQLVQGSGEGRLQALSDENMRLQRLIENLARQDNANKETIAALNRQLHELKSTKKAKTVRKAELLQQIVELEDRLDREQRRYHILGVQNARDALKPQPEAEVKTEIVSSQTNAINDGDELENLRLDIEALKEVSEMRQNMINQLISEKSAVKAELDGFLDQYHNTGLITDDRIRATALFLSCEQRAEEAEARNSTLEQRMEALTKEFNTLQQQRLHDNGLRDQLHKQQLTNQEEKIQTLEKRLRQVMRDKDQFQLELETKKGDKPNAVILKQLTDQITKLQTSLSEIQEEKKKYSEQIAEMRRTIESYQREARTLNEDETLRDLQRKVEEKAAEFDQLLGELGNMENACIGVQQNNAKLLKQQAQVEETNMSLVAERAKQTKQISIVTKQNAQYQEKIAKLDELVKTQAATLEKANQRADALESQLKAVQEQVTALQSIADSSESTARSLNTVVVEMKLKIQEYENEISRIAVRGSPLNDEIEKLKIQIQKLTEERVAMKKRLDWYSAKPGNIRASSDSLMDEQQIAYYKKIVLCQICNERKKNTIITRCWHVFCRECVDANLETRHRKCPTCNSSFGPSDVKPLWI